MERAKEKAKKELWATGNLHNFGKKKKKRRKKRSDSERRDSEDNNATFLDDKSQEELQAVESDEQIQQQEDRSQINDRQLNELFPDDNEKKDPFAPVEDENDRLLGNEGSPDFHVKAKRKVGKKKRNKVNAADNLEEGGDLESH